MFQYILCIIIDTIVIYELNISRGIRHSPWTIGGMPFDLPRTKDGVLTGGQSVQFIIPSG
jgi:hypothetical protein